MNDTISMLMYKITQLAVKRQQPLIILQDPNCIHYQSLSPEARLKYDKPYSNYIATIGDAAARFEAFCASDLTEVYASLRSQLESGEGTYLTQSGAV
jgi:hypothetical protein